MQARAICRNATEHRIATSGGLLVAEGWHADCWLFFARQRASRGAESKRARATVAKPLHLATPSKRSAQKKKFAVMQSAKSGPAA
jgi:hypothetical protein